nr:hypothetical protein [Tanacetum cinerariifolium]
MNENSDVEAVSDTYFGDNGDDVENVNPNNEKGSSLDPFNIYDLLQKGDGRQNEAESNSSMSHPPGFTQPKDHTHVEAQVGSGGNLNSQVYEEVQKSNEHSFSNHRNTNVSLNKGGSILDSLDDMIKIGQIMGYDMKGCANDMEKIIRSKGVKEMETVTAMDVKYLCEQHIVSDNFVALYGTWISNKSKVLFISIYVPRSRVEKRQLWHYITNLISRFHGECLLMGDFNEVRSEEERMGSIFNS